MNVRLKRLSTMPMHTEIEPRPNHLHAVVSGTFEPARLANMLKEIFAASTRHGLPKILIDISTLQGDISLMARYDRRLQKVAELQCEKVRLTIVGSKTQIWPDRFFENVANNRGVMTKVTLDMAEALEWLHADTATKSLGISFKKLS